MVSASVSGKAMGSRPLGATSPNKTEAQAEPVASPPRKSASRNRAEFGQKGGF